MNGFSFICKASELEKMIRFYWNAHLFMKDCWRYQEPLETADFKGRMN